MKQKIIVDTSVWIEYFKNDPEITKIIDEGLYKNTIYLVGIVMAELLQGAKSKEEMRALLKCIDAVPYLNCGMKDWTDAGCVSFSLRKSGITVPLSDIIIFSIAQNDNAIIFTKDKHFNLIPGVRLFQSIG